MESDPGLLGQDAEGPDPLDRGNQPVVRLPDRRGLAREVRSRLPKGWQVCDWLRFANRRPQFGQLHSARISDVISCNL